MIASSGLGRLGVKGKASYSSEWICNGHRGVGTVLQSRGLEMLWSC